MGTFLIFGQEQFSKDLHLHAEKSKRIFACSLNFLIFSWSSFEEFTDLLFLIKLSYLEG